MNKLNVDDYVFDLYDDGLLMVENVDNAPLGPDTFEYDYDSGILYFNDDSWAGDYFKLMPDGITYVYVGSM